MNGDISQSSPLLPPVHPGCRIHSLPSLMRRVARLREEGRVVEAQSLLEALAKVLCCRFDPNHPQGEGPGS